MLNPIYFLLSTLQQLTSEATLFAHKIHICRLQSRHGAITTLDSQWINKIIALWIYYGAIYFQYLLINLMDLNKMLLNCDVWSSETTLNNETVRLCESWLRQPKSAECGMPLIIYTLSKEFGGWHASSWFFKVLQLRIVFIPIIRECIA